MDIIRQYANTTANYLPEDQRAELADEIFDELTEQHSERSDQSEWEFVAQLPHPIRYAGKFSSEQYLIGPQYFLPFVETLKSATWVLAVIYLALFIGTLGSEEKLVGAAIRGAGNFIDSWVLVAMVIVGVFYFMEKAGERLTWYDKWKPADLKDTSGTISKGETFFDVGFSMVAFLWWNDLFSFPSLFVHNGDSVQILFHGVPTWIFWLVNGLLLSDVVIAAIKLNQGFWSRKLRWLEVSFNTMWLGILALGVSSASLVTIIGTADLGDMASNVNLGIRGALLVIAIIVGVETLSHLSKLFKGPKT